MGIICYSCDVEPFGFTVVCSVSVDVLLGNPGSPSSGDSSGIARGRVDMVDRPSTVEGLQPRVKLIRIIFKTCSDIQIFLDDRNVQRNVGLASTGRAPQQRKMQNAKGIEKNFVTPNCEVLCRSLAMYVPPVMDVAQFIIGFMTGIANS